MIQISFVTINNFKFVREAINSIKTSRQYKILVIDNGSDTRMDEDFKDTTYIRFDSQVSLSECWNKAINTALEDPRVNYIFNPNDDVIFHEKTIDELVKFIDKSGYLMVTGNNIAPICDRYFTNYVWKDDSDFDMRPITNWREEGPDFSCWMVRRNFVDVVGYFDETFNPAYFEDNDMHYRILLSGNHAKRIMSAPYYHFGSQTARVNPRRDLGSHRTAGIFNKKWGCTPEGCMDGKGWRFPYNDPSKDYKFWPNSEKYGQPRRKD